MATKYGKQVGKQSNRSPAVTETGGHQRYGPSHWPTPQASTFHQRQVVTAQPQTPGSQTAQDEGQQSKYPCTFKGCHFRFSDRGALIKHKDSEHDYCTKCDIDFVDDEALHVHKMNSEKHIICPICGIDFKSEPGRDRHAKQVSCAFNVEVFKKVDIWNRCTRSSRTCNAVPVTEHLPRVLRCFSTLS